MKAIEATGKIDKAGNLKLDVPLEAREERVKVIILFEGIDDKEEDLWLKAVSNNPAFDFLKDSSEDIYTLESGKPFSD